MRPDMAKVVTERPRGGHEARSQKFALRLSKDAIRREIEDDSERGGLVPWSRQRNQDWKTLSDLLGPLRKYLRKQVGRPWDKVWSEVCRNLDRRTVAGLHIFDHIKREVHLDAQVGDDGLIVAPSNWGRELRPVTGLYVHPRTGLLRLAAPRRYSKTRWETKFREELRRFGIRADGTRERLLAYRIDGLRVWEKKKEAWIVHSYREAPGRKGRPPRRTLVHSKQASGKEIQAVGGGFLARPPF